MKLDPLDTVADIAANVSTALKLGVRYKDVLSRTAQERYDWTSVGRRLVDELDALSARGVPRIAVAPRTDPIEGTG